jgi:TolB-like protein
MKKVLLTAVLVLIGVVAFSQERIAVFPFEDMDNVFTRNESTMFYREFSNEFANRSSGRFAVIPRQEIEKLINTEADFQLREFSARAKTAEMGRVLNGSQILSGLIGRVGNNIRITVSLYTYPELQQLPGGATLSVANKNELFSKIPELVQSMQNAIAGGGTDQLIPVGLEFEIARGSVTITKYTGNAATVNIPSRIQGFPVTVIGESAFAGSSLTSIIIPSSVTVIGDEAFFSCDSLTSVSIPFSVTAIGNGAFYNCLNLTSVSIPSSVTAIGNGAFAVCDSLTSITVDSRNPAYAIVDGVLFDKSIRTIIRYPAGKKAGTYAIPSSVTSIGDYAFDDCESLINITIPSSVTSIGKHAFSDCSSLTSISIPSSVTSIGEWAFSGCSSLTSVSIPSSVTSIGRWAFSVCSSLTSASIPSSVTSIGERAFSGCSSLTNVSIPSSVTSIEQEAFYNCTSLISVSIPSSVTSIRARAFSYCSSLTSITLSRRTQVGTDAFPPSARITYRD